MSAATTLDPPTFKSIDTTLNYYLDPSQGGHTSYQIGVSDYYRRKFDPHTVRIHNLRGREDEFKLDTHGFQHIQHTSAEKDFSNDENVRRVVYPETEQLIKDITGATNVHVFSHITRRDSPEETQQDVNSKADLQDGDAPVQKVVPARYVHVDHSQKGAQEIFKDNLDPQLWEHLSKSRWGIINVWRPIKPISKDPLAVCDARSARDQDMMPVTALLPPKGSGQYADVSDGERFEISYKCYHPDEKWYYVEKMCPSEVLMIKIFDSLQDGNTSRRCPHSAFTNPKMEADSTRESIEVRCLVFY